MSRVRDRAVTKDDEGYGFVCPITDPKDRCGDPASGVRFSSTGWPTKAIALDRLDGHIAEHKGESEGESLEAFRARHGLVQSEDGRRAVVTAEDV